MSFRRVSLVAVCVALISFVAPVRAQESKQPDAAALQPHGWQIEAAIHSSDRRNQFRARAARTFPVTSRFAATLAVKAGQTQWRATASSNDPSRFEVLDLGFELGALAKIEGWGALGLQAGAINGVLRGRATNRLGEQRSLGHGLLLAPEVTAVYQTPRIHSRFGKTYFLTEHEFLGGMTRVGVGLGR